MRLLIGAVGLLGFACSPAASQVVILDQIGPGGSLLLSGGFLTGYFHHFSTPPVGFGNRATIDDFVLTRRMRITSIECVLGSTPGATVNWANVPNWRVEMYSSPQVALNNNLTGDAYHAVTPTLNGLTFPFGPGNFGPNPMMLARADIDVTLEPGMYWATIIPQNSSTNGYGMMMGADVGNPFIVWQVLPGQTVLPINHPGLAIRITGEEAGVCYPDCTGDAALTVADFACFQNAFVASEPYADCNVDQQWTIADFGCFQNAFVEGCP